MTGLLSTQSGDGWTILEDRIDLESIRFQEAILTLGNGYLGSRGILEEGYAEGYAGTYIAGIYDKSGGQSFAIVNAPNPLVTEVYVDGNKLSADTMEVVEHRRVLDMKRAVLLRHTIFADAGRRYEYESRRFFSLKDMHVGVVNISIRCLDSDARIVVKQTIDGTTTNGMHAVGGPRKHYAVTRVEELKGCLSYLEARTNDLGQVIGIATIGRMKAAKPSSDIKTKYLQDEESITRESSIDAKEGNRYEFEEYVSIYTSRETAGDVKSACLNGVDTAERRGTSRLLREHAKVWESRWRDSDIRIEGDSSLQKSLRFGIYHLLAAAPPQDIDVSIAAKALSGEWYQGHVFWDTEVFMLPFFIYTQPELAKAFLMYRYRRLQQAGLCAQNQNYRGALWPWESAGSGEDETPDTWVNFDGTVLPVHNSKREHHIAADIVYALHNYYQATGDEDFFLHYGAEMVFETARFWESRVVFDETSGFYEIRQVIGPNEFQEGVDNNSYTNGLTRWLLRYAAELYERLQETFPRRLRAIADKIGLMDEEVRTWRGIADGLVFLMGPNGLIEEFEGYFQREDVTTKGWNKHGMPVWPSGVLLERVKETQLIKQADVVLLLYLLPDEFSLDVKRANFNYYEPRTTHMSSLSMTSYAILASQIGYGAKAYRYLRHASASDLENIHGNTERGVHAAELGGAWQIAIHGFAGLRVKDDALSINPALHESWQKLRFRAWFRGRLIEFTVSNGETQATMVIGRKPVDLEIYGRKQVLQPAGTITVKR